MSGVSAAFRGEPVGDEVRERAFKRLRMLWTLEAVNLVLVPAAVTTVVLRSGGSIGLAMISGGLLCAALPVLGTLYWRAKLAQLRSGASVLPGRAGFARVKPVAAGAVMVSAAGWVVPLAAGNADAAGLIGGVVLWTMGALEYVNYFHRQVMHDTRADVRRLVATRRLRRSFLALDLERPPP